jgi:hypothetical protein
MRRRLLLVPFAILLLCGCGTDQRVLEDLGIIHSIGYDIAPNTEEDDPQHDRLQITLVIPKSARKENFKEKR